MNIKFYDELFLGSRNSVWEMFIDGNIILEKNEICQNCVCTFWGVNSKHAH